MSHSCTFKHATHNTSHVTHSHHMSHSCTFTHSQTYMSHTHTHAYSHTSHTCMLTQTHTHAHTHARTHAHTHTHTHTHKEQSTFQPLRVDSSACVGADLSIHAIKGSKDMDQTDTLAQTLTKGDLLFQCEFEIVMVLRAGMEWPGGGPYSACFPI